MGLRYQVQVNKKCDALSVPPAEKERTKAKKIYRLTQTQGNGIASIVNGMVG